MSLFNQEYSFDFKNLTLRMDNPYDRVFQVMPAGRKTFRFPQWWDKGAGVAYITCSSIKFDHPSGDDRYLVWPYSSDAAVRGMWDGSVLHIYEMRGIRNLALFCSDRTTLLRTWTPRPNPKETPNERIFNLTCAPLVCLPVGSLPELGVEPGVRPELPCVFGEPTALETLSTLP